LKTLKANNSGFTFIEVMIATVIFVLAALASMDLARGSVKAVKDAQDVTLATWLLQRVIVELETQIETQGIDRACQKKKEGKFEEPYAGFSFATFCSEVDFKISEQASAILGDDSSDDSNRTQEDQFKKLFLQTASKYMSQASRELHAEVTWMQGKTPRKIDVTTHIARYDLPPVLPGFPGMGQEGGN
jgi:prepilin-type N-terminal cleavage/methylation domain-containing protein